MDQVILALFGHLGSEMWVPKAHAGAIHIAQLHEALHLLVPESDMCPSKANWP